jgi:hypothetical protein
MLKPHEIFAQMSADMAAQIFGHLHEKEKPLYRATMESLAKQRNLRAVFVERKPKAERHTWMKEALGRRAGDAVAAHILQIWLVGAHSALLCEFLDGFGIAHDSNGTIDTLPLSPEPALLLSVVDGLLQKYPQETVAVYLHAFQAIDGQGWESLETLVKEDPRLTLNTQPATTA